MIIKIDNMNVDVSWICLLYVFVCECMRVSLEFIVISNCLISSQDTNPKFM